MHENSGPATLPPPDPRQNPFRAPASAPAPAPTTLVVTTPAAPGAPATEPAPPPVNPNVELLKEAVKQLKYSGVTERDGRTYLTINQAFYKEGDVIRVTVKGRTVLLRATKVTRTSLTVTLNDAEQTLKF